MAKFWFQFANVMHTSRINAFFFVIIYPCISVAGLKQYLTNNFRMMLAHWEVDALRQIMKEIGFHDLSDVHITFSRFMCFHLVAIVLLLK